MALSRINQLGVRCKYLQPVIFSQYFFKDTPVSRSYRTAEFDDVLDNFTTELLQKKKAFWDNRKLEKIVNGSVSNTLSKESVDVSTLSRDELHETFINFLDKCEDHSIILLVKDCLQKRICPSKDVLNQILIVCAQKGELFLIQGLKDLCENNKIQFSANFDFVLYEAYAIWMKGNVIKALEILENVYSRNPFLRRHIRISLKRLIDETKHNSEAVLMQIVQFSERMVYNYKDYFLMIHVWENCFLSEWFSDQQIALELTKKHMRLGELIIHRLPYILFLSLKNHRTEAVYRLLEIFLHYDWRNHYTLVIMAFLDYHFLQQNLRAYSEILKWSHCKEVILPNVYKEKYLQLLLNNEVQQRPASHSKKKNTLEFLF